MSIACDGSDNVAVNDLVAGINNSAKFDGDNVFTGSNTFTEPIITDTIISEDSTATIDVRSIGNAYGKNRVINGDFKIWQDGTSFVRNNAGGMTADMTFSGGSTGEITITKGTMDSQSIKSTITVAASDLTGDKSIWSIWHGIEAQNMHDLNGKYVTVSFNILANFSGTLSLCLLNEGYERSYVTDFVVVADTKQRVTKTILLEAATIQTNDTALGLVINIAEDNKGDQVTTTTDAWHDGNLFISNNAYNWTEVVGNSIEVSQLQLEEGSGAGKFEFVDYSTQLSRCQRYYGKYVAKSDNDWGFQIQGVYNSTSQIILMHQLSTPMRIVPTLTYSNVSDFQVEPFDNVISYISPNYSGSTKQVTFAANDSQAEGFTGAGASLIFDKKDGWLAFDARF